MASKAQAEQLLQLFKQVLAEVIDEVLTAKLAAIAPRQTAAAQAEASPAWKRIHVSVREAAEILGVHTRTIYVMHREGELRLTKLRRRTFVPIAELERLRGAAEQSLAPAPQPAPPKPRIKKRRLIPRE